MSENTTKTHPREKNTYLHFSRGVAKGGPLSFISVMCVIENSRKRSTGIATCMYMISKTFQPFRCVVSVTIRPAGKFIWRSIFRSTESFTSVWNVKINFWAPFGWLTISPLHTSKTTKQQSGRACSRSALIIACIYRSQTRCWARLRKSLSVFQQNYLRQILRVKLE